MRARRQPSAARAPSAADPVCGYAPDPRTGGAGARGDLAAHPGVDGGRAGAALRSGRLDLPERGAEHHALRRGRELGVVRAPDHAARYFRGGDEARTDLSRWPAPPPLHRHAAEGRGNLARPLGRGRQGRCLPVQVRPAREPLSGERREHDLQPALLGGGLPHARGLSGDLRPDVPPNLRGRGDSHGGRGAGGPRAHRPAGRRTLPCDRQQAGARTAEGTLPFPGHSQGRPERLLPAPEQTRATGALRGLRLDQSRGHAIRQHDGRLDRLSRLSAALPAGLRGHARERHGTPAQSQRGHGVQLRHLGLLRPPAHLRLLQGGLGGEGVRSHRPVDRLDSRGQLPARRVEAKLAERRLPIGHGRRWILGGEDRRPIQRRADSSRGRGWRATRSARCRHADGDPHRAAGQDGGLLVRPRVSPRGRPGGLHGRLGSRLRCEVR